MPNKRISELPSATTPLTGSEEMEIVQGGINKKVSAADVGATNTNGHVIEDEGAPLTQRTKLNFVGSGVTVTDDSGDDATVVTVTGGGDVTKVGTPVNNQVGVWTGDGTIEGDAALTFDTTTDKLSTVALNLSGLTASLPVRTDASKNLESRAVADFRSDLGINPTRVSVSVSAGTLTLDLDSKVRRKFLLGTQSSNFTIALSNATNLEEFDLDMAITGTVAITMPSTFRMNRFETIAGRWNTSTRILTITGVTASPFTLAVRYDGTIHRLECSNYFE